jgi:hypothetical protein
MAGVSEMMGRVARAGLRKFQAARSAGESPRKPSRARGGGTFAAVVKALKGDNRSVVRSILSARSAALKRRDEKAAGDA